MTQMKKAAEQTADSQNSPAHFANSSGTPSNRTMHVIRVGDIATTPKSKGMLPVSPATIWRWVRESKNGFPKPFKLGDSVTVWNLAEIEAFIAQRAGGATK